MATSSETAGIFKSEYQKSVASYWNDNPNDDRINYLLGEVDGIHHHHYGLGEPKTSVLDEPADKRQAALIAELHRLEMNQANYLLDNLGEITPADTLLDAGCGRGGTSVMAAMRFNCKVNGVSISDQQIQFANSQAKKLGVDDRATFYLRNMLDTRLDDHSTTAIWTNETTMYVDLDELYTEFSRLLKPGGRYVNITGAANDAKGMKSRAVTQIDGHYGCNIHMRSEYLRQLEAHGLAPVEIVDLTPQTVPYWELRTHSELSTGVEKPFLSSFKDGSFQYLMIVAEKV